MTFHVKDAGSWKEAEVYVKDGGSWKLVEVSVKDAGSWKQVTSLLSVSPNTANSSNTNQVPNDAYAGVQFNSSGTEWGSNASGTFNVGRNQWLDSGSSSDVWVERVINSGSLNSLDPGSGRKQLSTTRSYRVVRTTVGTHSCNVTFNFYDAATGGNLIGSATIDISATKEFA